MVNAQSGLHYQFIIHLITLTYTNQDVSLTSMSKRVNLIFVCYFIKNFKFTLQTRMYVSILHVHYNL